ncbi:MAG: hypothetical protein IKI15_01775 [Lachnospiraceae bacterium]|nr:hypothetical protein [Lachnospiraceae bacterium]
MKRKFEKYLLLIIPAVVLLIAVILIAGRKKKTEEDKSEVGKEVFVYDSVDPQTFYSEHTVFYVDESVLHMIDTTSGVDMVYCDRPNCSHMGLECPAWVIGRSAMPYNGHLYYFGNIDDKGAFTMQYLYEADANGENRGIVTALHDVQDIQYLLYRDKYVIGAYRNHVEVDEEGMIINDNREEAAIFVIDLESKKVQMGEKVPGLMPDVGGIYYEDGAVYYLCTHFDDTVTETMVNEAFSDDFAAFMKSHLVFELYRYDIASEAKTLLKTFAFTESPEFTDGDVFYQTSDGYFLYDRKSGESVKLPIAAGSGRVCRNNGVLYYNYVEEGSRQRVYCRLVNGTAEELMRMADDESFVIMAMCGKSVYVGYSEGNSYCMGVMSLDDLDHGNFNVKDLRYFGK